MSERPVRHKPRVAMVTGAAGFIGSHIVELLGEHGVRVRALILPGEPTSNLDEALAESVAWFQR